ncbi:MAG TPA: NAD(P)H-dependent oxidoreductase subunit E, partial [Candidatus Acidoferrum sp.]|nr:NAD(P)H-dependent oxidoreductase subunit E [Candidatus Acidoferrum sp.]
MPLDLSYVDDTVARLGRAPDAVIPVLQALQDHYGYLPEEALRRVCASTHITPAALSGVATFYDMFRHKPVGKHIVQVCHGTACHVGGAERVEDALRRHLRIPEGDDTDAERKFTIERVACLGCCTLAPVVRIAEETTGYATPEKIPGTIQDFLARPPSPSRTALDQGLQPKPRAASRGGNGGAEIKVCLDSCCRAKGTDRVFQALQESIVLNGANASVKRVGCVGACYRTPMLEVAVPGRSSLTYTGLTLAETERLVSAHCRPQGLARRVSRLWNQGLEVLLLDDGRLTPSPPSPTPSRPPADDQAFFGRQVHIAMEHHGRLDPLDLDEYMAHEGFVALRRCLGDDRSVRSDGSAGSVRSALTSEEIIKTIESSGLRGRGGAGFPTGQKWRLVRQQAEPTKYVVCNGDEGDPGAFMDRMILESFPYRVIEGLAIAAVAVGAHEAIFYVRHEYPQALWRLRAALAEVESRGWLGERLLGSDYPLRISIKEGAGAFVCGEETALIASVEGRRGMPRLRPPFPAQAGLWGKPTLINNVETLAMVPWIIRHGGAAFAGLGTATSKGTKVFSLAGKVRRAGLIEIPMGTTLRQIVEEIGGGVGPGRRFKAVQIGGPSGGCVPARLADTPVDYESLRAIGAIMGSGGMVVLDDTACMVDIARYFLQFTQNQSCGKCTFCRIG